MCTFFIWACKSRTCAYAVCHVCAQAHALLIRHMGGNLPCPAIDFDEGFNALMSVAYGLTDSYQPNSVELIKLKFGAPFDPFKNDQNFVVSGVCVCLYVCVCVCVCVCMCCLPYKVCTLSVTCVCTVDVLSL
jgi:hypothetical protein